MTKQFETVSVTAARDYNSYTRYEFCVMAEVGDDEWETLEREGGFKSKATAQRAGLKAAEKFLAPSLF